MGLSGDNGLILDVNYFLDGMGDRVPEIAQRAAKPIQDFTRANHARGLSPSGKQNAPRKRDGAVAYLRPTQAITFRGDGSNILGEGEDVLKYPQTSSKYPREIFPNDTANIPPEYENAIKNAAETVISENAPVDK
jgi:hypothetical protein